MEESLSLLQKSPLLDDKRVVVWLKLQRILDEGMSAFGFDDASTSFSLSELRIQVILRVFERRMQDWMKLVPPDVMTRKFYLLILIYVLSSLAAAFPPVVRRKWALETIDCFIILGFLASVFP